MFSPTKASELTKALLFDWAENRFYCSRGQETPENRSWIYTSMREEIVERTRQLAEAMGVEPETFMPTKVLDKIDSWIQYRAEH
jgi:hypothetical protein